jgi:hypothetical protein
MMDIEIQTVRKSKTLLHRLTLLPVVNRTNIIGLNLKKAMECKGYTPTYHILKLSQRQS